MEGSIDGRRGVCVCTLYTDKSKDEWKDVCVHYIQMNGRIDRWKEGCVCTLYTDKWKDG